MRSSKSDFIKWFDIIKNPNRMLNVQWKVITYNRQLHSFTYHFHLPYLPAHVCNNKHCLLLKGFDKIGLLEYKHLDKEMKNCTLFVSTLIFIHKHVFFYNLFVLLLDKSVSLQLSDFHLFRPFIQNQLSKKNRTVLSTKRTKISSK